MNNEELYNYVTKKMYGWWGGDGHCWPVLGAIVRSKSCGNHLEIGTLFGASAIFASLIMEDEGIDGKIYTVDPCLYETHEYCSRAAGNLTPDIVKYQPEIIRENIKRFELEKRIVFIQKSSNPIPEELYGITFDSCFIDGYHYNGMPMIDVKNCIDLFDIEHLILDDTHLGYPEIIKAMRYILGLKNWGMTISYNGTTAFQRLRTTPKNWAVSIAPKMDKSKLNWPEFMMEEELA